MCLQPLEVVVELGDLGKPLPSILSLPIRQNAMLHMFDACHGKIVHTLIVGMAEINDCTNDSKLIEIGPVLYQPFHTYFLHLLQEPPSDHSTTKFQALDRDKYRCALSGKLDAMAVRPGFVSISAEHRITSTEAAHIFPSSTNTNIDEGSDEHVPKWLTCRVLLNISIRL
ncbi:hypothetical protein APHAL10511_005592 [Amanita phalloides]|nr:hypothetical protein APHAL10511_005592 [Amanita phalloides]